jgi:hypothetical protein
MIFAVAASVLIVVGVTTLAMRRQHNQQIARAVIDLRDRSIARGTEHTPTEPSLGISHTTDHLDIYLPLGSSEGPYDVRISSIQGEVFFAGEGTAKVQQEVTLLPVDISQSTASPGRYVLQLRKAGSGWNSYPLQIK